MCWSASWNNRWKTRARLWGSVVGRMHVSLYEDVPTVVLPDMCSRPGQRQNTACMSLCIHHPMLYCFRMLLYPSLLHGTFLSVRNPRASTGTWIMLASRNIMLRSLWTLNCSVRTTMADVVCTQTTHATYRGSDSGACGDVVAYYRRPGAIASLL